MIKMLFAMIFIMSACSVYAVSDAHELYIQNDEIKVGVDLSIGGAITHVSKIGGPNMINSCDWGRQIQQSYYSGPANYTKPGKEKSPGWAGFCWNPIQSGDSYNNGSKVVAHKVTDNSIYVKTQPMLWPMRDDPGECYFETWITLKGSAFTWRARIVNSRSDKTFYGGYPQELPAVYTNGPWHKLMSYTGSKPFTSGELVEIRNDHNEAWPWCDFLATEGWAALVDESNQGIGVICPTISGFAGGFAGKRGKGGPKDSPTGYMSPTNMEVLDYNITYEYKRDFYVGTLQEIREYAVKQRVTKLPVWKFDRSRASWTYTNAVDDGWPVKDGINIKATGAPIRLIGPFDYWNAEGAQYVAVRTTASREGVTGNARVYWRGMGDKPSYTGTEWGVWASHWWESDRSVVLPLVSDGKPHWSTARLADNALYTGGITGLAIDLPTMTPDSGIRIHEIRLVKDEKALSRLK
ncbi:MAG: hypothetical protein ACYC0V_06070 [Armatimonadota bacterium]